MNLTILAIGEWGQSHVDTGKQRGVKNLGFLVDVISLSIYISTYIAPVQGNYSEALPAQARPKRRVLLWIRKRRVLLWITTF